MATPLANFFTRIGFEVDKSSIRDVEKNLERLESRIKSMANSFQSITNAPAVRAATRLANAEARRITAEMNLNKQGMSVEKLKQQNIIEATRLERNKQMTAKVVEQSRLQELRNKAQEMRANVQQRPRISPTNSPQTGNAASPLFTTENLSRVAQFEAVRRFAQQSFRVGNFQIAQPAQFEFVTGNAEDAQKEIAFLNSEVDRLSLNMMDANKQYLKLFAAGGKKIGSEKTRELFSGFGNLATMLGLSADAQNRGLNAFVQMISKDQVYAEELRSQLSEALPGAVNIFADALFGGDTKKLFKEMEEGRVRMNEIIKVIEYMRKLTDDKKVAEYVSKSPEKAFQRMSNAWMRFIMEVNNAGLLDAMTAALNGAADAISVLTKSFKGLVPIVKQVWNVLQPLLVVMGGLFVYGRILKLVAAMKAMKVGLAGAAVVTDRLIEAQFLLGAALYKVQQILKRSFVVVGFLAIIDLIETLQGKQTVLTNMLSQGGWIATLAKSLIAVGRIIELSMNGLIALFTGDFEYASVALEKFKKDMLDLFPFDMWIKQWGTILQLVLAAGKVALNPMNPMAYNDLYNAYQGYQNFNAVQNARVGVPSMLAKPQQGGNTTTINAPISINGTGLDPQAISKAVAEQLNITFMQSQSNYVMRNGAK